jgi:hypothetical protein
MTMEKLLTQEQAADLLQLSAATLERMRARGDGPPYLKIGRSKSSPVRYSPSALAKYLADCARRCTPGVLGGESLR